MFTALFQVVSNKVNLAHMSAHKWIYNWLLISCYVLWAARMTLFTDKALIWGFKNEYRKSYRFWVVNYTLYVVPLMLFVGGYVQFYYYYDEWLRSCIGEVITIEATLVGMIATFLFMTDSMLMMMSVISNEGVLARDFGHMHVHSSCMIFICCMTFVAFTLGSNTMALNGIAIKAAACGYERIIEYMWVPDNDSFQWRSVLASLVTFIDLTLILIIYERSDSLGWSVLSSFFIIVVFVIRLVFAFLVFGCKCFSTHERSSEDHENGYQVVSLGDCTQEERSHHTEALARSIDAHAINNV